MLMKVKLIKEEFNENLNIRESKEFQDLSERIVSQVKENESFQIRINLSVCCIFQTTIVYFTSNSQRLRCAFDRSQFKALLSFSKLLMILFTLAKSVGMPKAHSRRSLSSTVSLPSSLGKSPTFKVKLCNRVVS